MKHRIIKFLAFFLIIFPFFFTAIATAQFRTKINQLNRLNFDGTNLEVAYRISGGQCEHIPKIIVSLNKDDHGVHALVDVFDVTDKYDAGEALLFPSTKVNLKRIILLQAINDGYEIPYQVDIILPHVSYLLASK